MQELDAIDYQILNLLQTDSRLSAVDIAKKVGLSQSPCWRRIQRLEKASIIQRRVALLDRRQLNLHVMVFVQIKLSVHGRSALLEFEQAIAKHPEILECHRLTGSFDYLLCIVACDVDSYERFLRQQLYPLKTVQDIHSSMVLSTVKSETALPLPDSNSKA